MDEIFSPHRQRECKLLDFYSDIFIKNFYVIVTTQNNPGNKKIKK